MPTLLPRVNDILVATEDVAFRFNPGVPVVSDVISVAESVTISRSFLEINVFDTRAITEIATPFTLTPQDTQGGGGSGGAGISGAAQELWRPIWLIDMSGITVLPAGFVAADLHFANLDLDNLAAPFTTPFYGKLVDNPTIDRRLMNVFWGVTEIADLTFSLVNADGAFTDLYTKADLREQPVTIIRYDLASEIIAEEYHARISSVGLQNGKITITASSPALTLFEQLVPSVLIDKTTYPRAISVGVPIPVVFGSPKRIPLPYINDDTTQNQYDYVVGYGTDLSVPALYRNGPNDTLVTITSAEYSISTTLYPGLTVVRFSVRQVDFLGGFHDIFADVDGPSRDFSDAIMQVLTNTTWALGQAVDAASFATAKADLTAFGNMYCDGVVNQQVQAQDLLRLLMIVRGMRLGFSSTNEWTLVVDKVPPAIQMRLRDGTGDGERNIVTAGRRTLVPTSSAISRYIIKYRLNFPKGGNSSDYDFSLFRPVNIFGKETVLEHPLIRDHETADRVVDYLAKREKFSQDSCDFEATQEARQTREGDLIFVFYLPHGYQDTIVEIREVEKKLEGIHLVVSGWDASIFVYEPGPLPTDVETPPAAIFIPRPGYLEIPGQKLNQTFVGPDILIHWAAVSELFVGAQDEQNLPGQQIAGYWVRVWANPTATSPGVKVRDDFIPVAIYLYTLVVNKLDNPPFGARVITFVVQAQSTNGLLGEENYITVTNEAISLGPLAVGPAVDTIAVTEAVTIATASQFGFQFDVITITEFVDVVVGARRINVYDDDRFINIFDVAVVEINGRSINVAEFVDEYDHVERIESSGTRVIVLSDDVQTTDSVTIVRS
jgi:hypothetical protein